MMMYDDLSCERKTDEVIYAFRKIRSSASSADAITIVRGEIEMFFNYHPLRFCSAELFELLSSIRLVNNLSRH